MKLARVFPRRTKASPTDPLAFFRPPELLDDADEVHVSVKLLAQLTGSALDQVLAVFQVTTGQRPAAIAFPVNAAHQEDLIALEDGGGDGDGVSGVVHDTTSTASAPT